MQAECLSQAAVPHTSRLYADYLERFETVRRYYAQPPLERAWFASQAQTVRYDGERRQRVAAVLERQNRAWGTSPATVANLERFRRGAFASVTGQQVTLFGGPLFALYKALTAIHFAAQATAAGVDTVPIFWLATEDHDLAEISRVTVLGPDGALHPFEAMPTGPAGAPVSAVHFVEDIAQLVHAVRQSLGDSDLNAALASAYRAGTTPGEAFARLYAHVFRDYGILLLDSSDPELHAVAAPVYRAAIVGASDLDEALLARGRELEGGGYHQQVKVTPSSTLVFALNEGARVAVHRANGQFEIAGRAVSPADLLARIQAAPHQFSANVLLRPVVQDYVLPTLAYVGGPAEVAYFAQAEVVYRELLGRTTPILPRLHATLVEPRVKRLLDKYGLSPTDAFLPLDELRERLATAAIPADLQAKFATAETDLQSALDDILAQLSKLDPTAAQAAAKSAEKIRYQLGRMRHLAGRSEIRRHQEISRHAELLANSLYPNKNLQERELAGVSFLARYPDLLSRLASAAQQSCPGMQVLYL